MVMVANPATGMSIRRKIDIEEINKTDGFTPRVQRIKQAFLGATSMVCSDRGYYFWQSWKETEGQHESTRVAKMFRSWCQNARIVIHPDELLVGGITPFARGTQPRPETEPVPLLARLKEEDEKLHTVSLSVAAKIDKFDLDRLLEACEGFKDYFENLEKIEKERGAGPVYKVCHWARRTPVLTPEQRAWKIAFWGMGVQPKQEGQVRGLPVPSLVIGCDYEKVITRGFNGIIAEVRERIAGITAKPRKDITPQELESIEVLNSWIIALEGMITYSRRHAALAREMAATETDAQRKNDLLKIADVCENVPANPARNFHEALQVSWLILVGQEIEKTSSNALIGRFDQYTYPYYKADILEGRMTRQEAAELMGCLFLKWQSLESFTPWGFQRLVPGSYLANVNVGGVDRCGKDAANEVSCLLLHVAKQVKTNQPHVSFLWHRAVAPELLNKAIECTRDHGGGIPAWFNNQVMIEYLLDRGVPHEEARDGAIIGCVNMGTPKGYIWRRSGGPGFINHAKLIELVMNNGVEPKTGFKLGPATGDPRSFKTFEEFDEAYRQHYDYFIDNSLERNWKGWTRELYFAQEAYSPFSSGFNEDCIPRALDLHHGGMRYFDELCGGGWMDRSQSDATDSLCAIRKVVFEDKTATMAEMCDAIKANWVGYEELLKKVQAAPKYGNDDDEADALHVKWWDYTKNKTMHYRDFKGLRMAPHRQGAGWAQLNGKVTGAMPNGRKAWTALSDASVSACQSADTKGPTAMLNSAAKLDPQNMEAPLLNMRFTPGPLRTREGMRKFGEMIGTFFDQGAAHVQFTILDRATLLDAKEHPENYRSLVVRVAGYSAFWVELTPEVQDEIITRTEHEITCCS